MFRNACKKAPQESGLKHKTENVKDTKHNAATSSSCLTENSNNITWNVVILQLTENFITLVVKFSEIWFVDDAVVSSACDNIAHFFFVLNRSADQTNASSFWKSTDSYIFDGLVYPFGRYISNGLFEYLSLWEALCTCSVILFAFMWQHFFSNQIKSAEVNTLNWQCYWKSMLQNWSTYLHKYYDQI